MKKITFFSIIVSSFISAQSLEEIISGNHRTEKNKARDQYRNPIETLNFFGIKNNMTVVELNPGGGWYQEILAPFLKDKGKYVFSYL
jgi:Predicted methyltransferase